MSDPERIDLSADEFLSEAENGEHDSSPSGFAQIFEEYGHLLIARGSAQRLGNYIYPYWPSGGRVAVKESRRHGRVTYVKRMGNRIPGNDFPITHELHFPSVDDKGRDFSVKEVLFVRNEFDSNGQILNRDTFRRTDLYPDDPERERFLEELFEL